MYAMGPIHTLDIIQENEGRIRYPHIYNTVNGYRNRPTIQINI